MYYFWKWNAILKNAYFWWKNSTNLGVTYLCRSTSFNEWHKLEYHDYERRVNFAQWFLSLHPATKFSLICSDEAYFFLTLPINKQNNRSWLHEWPIGWIEVPLYDEKVLVWCAISAEGILGPYFFEETVNQYNYLKMLQNFFWRRHVQTPN